MAPPATIVLCRGLHHPLLSVSQFQAVYASTVVALPSGVHCLGLARHTTDARCALTDYHNMIVI